MSNVDYNALLEAVKAKLGAIAPARIVTRTYQSFEHRNEPDLQTGIFTIVAAGVRAYPWDRVDSADGSPDGPGATSLPVFSFRVIGQGLLPEGADGPAIEAAEFAMLQQIEELADELVRDETLDEAEELCRVVLQGVDQSSQLEAPYYWIATLFTLDVR